MIDAVDVRTGLHQHRDGSLRLAHRRAFDKIASARGMRNQREVVARAVEELVDACEAYVDTH